jgi:hypothetical protein
MHCIMKVHRKCAHEFIWIVDLSFSWKSAVRLQVLGLYPDSYYTGGQECDDLYFGRKSEKINIQGTITYLFSKCKNRLLQGKWLTNLN